MSGGGPVINIFFGDSNRAAGSASGAGGAGVYLVDKFINWFFGGSTGPIGASRPNGTNPDREPVSVDGQNGEGGSWEQPEVNIPPVVTPTTPVGPSTTPINTGGGDPPVLVNTGGGNGGTGGTGGASSAGGTGGTVSTGGTNGGGRGCPYFGCGSRAKMGEIFGARVTGQVKVVGAMLRRWYSSIRWCTYFGWYRNRYNCRSVDATCRGSGFYGNSRSRRCQ